MASFGQLLASRKEIIIGTKFKIIRKIGNGSFGEVYLGLKIADGTHVAIKVESTKARHQTLRLESKVYRTLQGSVGIPRIRWYGCAKEHNVLVIDLLGPSLEDLFNYCGRKFSMKTVLMLADQLIERVQLVHSQGFIHRDLKPDNLLMGVGAHCHEVYMIDFGLAKEFSQIHPQAQIGTSQSKLKITGTARYASINALRGNQQSWRDDMESLGYVLIYFSRGSLPWQGIKAHTTRQKHERIREKKSSIPVEVLCKGYPQELAVYLNYCRDLRFGEVPDYMYLRQLFQTLMRKMGFENDYAFDFTILRLQSTENTTEQHSMQDIAQQPPLQPPPNEEPNAETAGRASGNNN